MYQEKMWVQRSDARDSEIAAAHDRNFVTSATDLRQNCRRDIASCCNWKLQSIVPGKCRQNAAIANAPFCLSIGVPNPFDPRLVGIVEPDDVVHIWCDQIVESRFGRTALKVVENFV